MARAITAEEARRSALLWSADASMLHHVRTGENCVWSFESGGRGLILRLTHEPHRTKDQLEAELDFVQYLAQNGLAVAAPVAAPAGTYVVDVTALLDARDVRTFAVVFERFPGRLFEYFSDDLERPLFHAWGAMMGRLHDLSTRFQPRRDRQRPHWLDDEVAGCAVTAISREETEVLAARARLIPWLRSFTPDARRYGMIHGDFERTNFLLDGGVLRLFDFDDCCQHWFAWDIACALWVFRNAAPEERGRFLAWFLEGYATIREADRELLEHFSELVQLRSVSLILHRLRRLVATTEHDERAWVARERGWLTASWHW